MRTKTPILLIGAGGHALSCIDIIEQSQNFEVFGLLERDNYKNSTILGYEVIKGDSALLSLRGKVSNALIAFGSIKSSTGRANYFKMLKDLGWMLPPIISNNAYVSRNAIINEGSIVMNGAIVNSGATIGKNCIINSNCLIEHGAIIQDHCHISTSATVNGDVFVGEGSFIGSGAVICDNVKVGRQSVIGLGMAVKENCADGTWIK